MVRDRLGYAGSRDAVDPDRTRRGGGISRRRVQHRRGRSVLRRRGGGDVRGARRPRAPGCSSGFRTPSRRRSRRCCMGVDRRDAANAFPCARSHQHHHAELRRRLSRIVPRARADAGADARLSADGDDRGVRAIAAIRRDDATASWVRDRCRGVPGHMVGRPHDGGRISLARRRRERARGAESRAKSTSNA